MYTQFAFYAMIPTYATCQSVASRFLLGTAECRHSRPKRRVNIVNCECIRPSSPHLLIPSRCLYRNDLRCEVAMGVRSKQRAGTTLLEIQWRYLVASLDAVQKDIEEFFHLEHGQK